MNTVCLIGRITQQPELKNNGNIQYVNFTIAVNREHKNQNGERQADFINCVAFGKTAEITCQYVNKGDMLAVKGRISTNARTAQDGTKRYSTNVVASNITFLQQKKAENKAPTTPAPEPEQEDIYSEFGNSIDDNWLD